MNKKIKKELLQWIAILGVFLFLFITGLHTEVFGFLQRGIIATGIMNPTIEKNILKEYPPADLSMELLNYEGKKEFGTI
ncbi:MAG TPA: hypothetical protein VFM82_10975 [Flavobacteriaceae bacterium]|nr:hypothetical protein [Flavobacteriaceae bacterium]